MRILHEIYLLLHEHHLYGVHSHKGESESLIFLNLIGD
jgi:hypothetical protein